MKMRLTTPRFLELLEKAESNFDSDKYSRWIKAVKTAEYILDVEVDMLELQALLIDAGEID